MHFYSFNVKDYTYETQHLSLSEHGALRLLIDRIHLIEKPLDSDEVSLFRLMCIDKEEDKEVIRRMLKEFFVKKKNGWTHKQSEIDIRFYKSQSERGKRGAKARWCKESHASALPTINQEPITKNKETKNTVSIEEESSLKTFEKFYSEYPKKVDKEGAKRIWLKYKPNLETVLNTLSWQKNSDEWQRDGGRWTPNPSKYIADKRWEDEMPYDPYSINFASRRAK